VGTVNFIIKSQSIMKRVQLLAFASSLLLSASMLAQGFQLPNITNPGRSAGITIGVTIIEIKWHSPGVKGREGKIWGTNVANYDFLDLGFGSTKESPWRAGADENTTMEFSTDVTIEGKKLAAGKYGFAIALYPDSSVLIFNKNNAAWGTYFYKPEEDALRVTVRQERDLPQSREWLTYTFSDPTSNSVVIALEWEHWRIPFKVESDYVANTLAYIQQVMTGGLGFDPPSLQVAAKWCADNNVNYDQALFWINSAVDPNLGGMQTFNALSTKSELLQKIGKTKEADETMKVALEKATVTEMHMYGRQLIGQKKHKEAMAVFQRNFEKYGDAWPTHVGLMRGYSANGDLKKALAHAKKALAQAPDDINRISLQESVKTLEAGNPISQ
jgi:tetratricopeptide (TPR) repeat protein